MFQLGYGGYIKNEKITNSKYTKSNFTDYQLFSLTQRIKYRVQNFLGKCLKVMIHNEFINDDYYYYLKILSKQSEGDELLQCSSFEKQKIEEIISEEYSNDEFLILLDSKPLIVSGTLIPCYWIYSYVNSIKFVNIKQKKDDFKNDQLISPNELNIETTLNINEKVPLTLRNFNCSSKSCLPECFVTVNLNVFYYYEDLYQLIIEKLINKIYTLYKSKYFFLPISSLEYSKYQQNTNTKSIIEYIKQNLDCSCTKVKNFDNFFFCDIEEEKFNQILYEYSSLQNYINHLCISHVFD